MKLQANEFISAKAQDEYSRLLQAYTADNGDADEETQAKMFAQAVELQILDVSDSVVDFGEYEQMTAVRMENGIYIVSGKVNVSAAIEKDSISQDSDGDESVAVETTDEEDTEADVDADGQVADAVDTEETATSTDEACVSETVRTSFALHVFKTAGGEWKCIDVSTTPKQGLDVGSILMCLGIVMDIASTFFIGGNADIFRYVLIAGAAIFGVGLLLSLLISIRR